ncbi:cobyric acid synthase CobQ [Pannus brasiliensis CCIBt3594]|uniref:Cobyric acid synthase n=1 Tax=Pannus brasiliensis CCIBt3594 TaxID=1427578 RepID=A0AAW9QKX3_9CHRO
MKAIMIVGTTSHAGKSFLTAGFCRLLTKKGWHVTPFKGQNMALNAYVTATGGEIGHAQAVQAWAAGTIPRVEMNPILLKPQGNMTSQVILQGQAVGMTTASEYYEKYFDRGWRAITESLAKLSMEYDLVVCEGAGSPAEINLKHRDLTNMRVAKHLNAATLLVVDIDRGGAFAHVVGTLALLEPEEKALIKGIVINKFRGQKSLLDSGITWLEEYTGIPVLGVLPYSEIPFSAEDSLSLLDRTSRPSRNSIDISILRLPRIANFTDFDALSAEESVNIRYTSLYDSLGFPDAVILPGTKTTLADLAALQESGMAEQLRNYHAAGGIIFGICGGFQMLGRKILDPDRRESDLTECEGLNLFPMTTVISPDKVTRQRQVISYYPREGLPVTGYEIHQGISRFDRETDGDYPSLFVEDSSLGRVTDSLSLWGCYLHGLFDNGPWRRAWLNHLAQRRGLPSLPTGIGNYREQREVALDRIARLIEENLDLRPILSGL